MNNTEREDLIDQLTSTSLALEDIIDRLDPEVPNKTVVTKTSMITVVLMSAIGFVAGLLVGAA